MVYLHLIKNVDFNLKLTKTTEAKNNWIETEDLFLDKTIKLDGEKFSGSANYFRLFETQNIGIHIYFIRHFSRDIEQMLVRTE